MIGSAANRALSLKAAESAIVLLDNKNNFLPLDKGTISKIAVLGPHADRFYKRTPNYDGNAINPITPLAGIKNRVSAGTRVPYAEGCPITGGTDAGIDHAAALAGASDVAVVYVGTDNTIEQEGRS